VTAFKLKFDNQILQVPGITRRPSRTSARPTTTASRLRPTTFDEASALAGLNVYANYTYTKAIQNPGATAGLDVPFYSRNTDTVGARYRVGAWTSTCRARTRRSSIPTPPTPWPKRPMAASA
jgi:Fe(3+) dicitrate transport protein